MILNYDLVASKKTKEHDSGIVNYNLFLEKKKSKLW